MHVLLGFGLLTWIIFNTFAILAWFEKPAITVRLVPTPEVRAWYIPGSITQTVKEEKDPEGFQVTTWTPDFQVSITRKGKTETLSIRKLIDEMSSQNPHQMWVINLGNSRGVTFDGVHEYAKEKGGVIMTDDMPPALFQR